VQNAGLVYLVAYWVLVLVISAVAANLRNPVLFVLGSCEVCGSFFPRGPRVVPLRRAPDASRDVAPQEHVL
jgi:hypothetical protein